MRVKLQQIVEAIDLPNRNWQSYRDDRQGVARRAWHRV